MLIDKYNRVHNYLRISLTDNCNLRCFYCMPEDDYLFTPASKLMQPREIESLAKLFVKEGVTKIRLTGGEPLVRKDAAEIIMLLSKLPINLAITTNGIRLHEFTKVIDNANIRSINISLDTLQEEKFFLITKRNLFSSVFNNIKLFLKKGFHIKLNVVVMRGVNDDEILDFIEWTKDSFIHIRFIEFMPFDGNRWNSNKVVTWHEILKKIEEKYSFISLAHEKNETSKKYTVPGHAGSFAVISTMSSNFCGDCNRLRLTSDGKLKNCLFSKGETDLLSTFRNGEDVTPLIRECVYNKAKELGGQFTQNFENIIAENISNRSMITIGG